MNQNHPQSRKHCRTLLMLALAVALLTGSFFAWYRPKIFSFYAKVAPIGGNVSGEVFKSSDGVFLVRLDSGSQLTVEGIPPKVYLSTKSAFTGFRVGSYLVVPAVSIEGVDLSKTESFDKQVPVINEGKITLKDPLQRNGTFYFPSSK